MTRILLLGCGKTKRAHASAARELYTGSLFRARRRHADEVGSCWAIVSAKHHLILPDDIVEPYELKITSLSKAERADWAATIVQRLHAWLLDALLLPRGRYGLKPGVGWPPIRVELHMGADYADPLEEALGAYEHFITSRPVRGSGVGHQLQWYSQKTKALQDSRQQCLFGGL